MTTQQVIGDSTWVGIIGIVLVLVQIVMIATFRGLKNEIIGLRSDMVDLWRRANTHGHTIECNKLDCKPKTTGVVLHEKGE